MKIHRILLELSAHQNTFIKKHKRSYLCHDTVRREKSLMAYLQLLQKADEQN